MKKVNLQPPEVLCKKRCSQKFCKIRRKTPVPGSLRTPFLQSTSGRLLLEKHYFPYIFPERNCSLQKQPPELFCKKGALRNLGKHLCQRLDSFNKVARRACNFINKESLAQLFSCEFCEIFKNTFFKEHLLSLASRIFITG